LNHPQKANWADYFGAQRLLNLSLDQEFSRYPWLRPRLLKGAEVSLFLKHRMAWRKLAEGPAELAIIAEDDIVFAQHSQDYLKALMAALPKDFDYIDLAGGCGFLPRPGNRVVNRYFYEIAPPSGRTTCCALLSRNFARELLALELPLTLPVDWTLVSAFQATQAKVYWLDPPLFGHGSELNVYRSSI
jgi:GR25 family glycosyltransferase involved in LPS biosynthesis